MVVDSGHAADSYPCGAFGHVDRTGLSQVVNVLGNPPPEVQVSHVVDCLVVASDKDGHDWRVSLGLEVLVETAHGLVFLGAVQVVQIGLVPESLEVPADDEQIELYGKPPLKLLYLAIDLIELSM